MARPTKYNEQMQEQAEWYLENFQEVGDVIPSVEGLAMHLGVVRSTIYCWEEAQPAFSDTLDGISQAQKKVTLNNGLNNTFNATIAKLVLANHGMHDKLDNQHTGKDGGKIEISQEATIQPVKSLLEIEKERKIEPSTDSDT